MDESAPTEDDEPAPWSTRRKVLIALGAVALAAVSFLAGTGGDLGWINGGSDGESDDRVEIIDAAGDWSRAQTVAADEGGGLRATVEVAPALDGGGQCVRVVLAERVATSRCGDPVLNPWDAPDFEVQRLDQYFGSLSEYAASVEGGWAVALVGAVHPEVVRVTAHFGDDAEYSFVTRNPGGWFVAVLPDDIADPAVDDGRLVNAPVRLDLFDAAGNQIASVDVTDGTSAV